MKPISISAVVGARTKSALTRVGSLGLALCLVSTPTYATDASIGADTGYASDHPECFQRVGGSLIINVCDNRQSWVIPLLTPFTGHHYRVRVRASPGGGGIDDLTVTECTVFSLNNENRTFQSARNFFTTIPFPTLQELVMKDIYVLGISSADRNRNGPGTLQVKCDVGGRDGAVLSVDLENLD